MTLHQGISSAKEFNKKLSLLKVKVKYYVEIIRNVYRLSWMNKNSLKKTFNNQKDNIFNR